MFIFSLKSIYIDIYVRVCICIYIYRIICVYVCVCHIISRDLLRASMPMHARRTAATGPSSEPAFRTVIRQPVNTLVTPPMYPLAVHLRYSSPQKYGVSVIHSKKSKSLWVPRLQASVRPKPPPRSFQDSKYGSRLRCLPSCKLAWLFKITFFLQVNKLPFSLAMSNCSYQRVLQLMLGWQPRYRTGAKLLNPMKPCCENFAFRCTMLIESGNPPRPTTALNVPCTRPCSPM